MTALKGVPFFIRTFGCQMNEHDSERIAGLLASAGAGKVGRVEDARLVVVNTCAVRKKSEEKLYSYLGRLRAWKRTHRGTIAVVGCVSQVEREGILDKCPDVDLVVGPDNYSRLAALLAEGLRAPRIVTSRERKWREEERGPALRESRVTARVTIMEGCDNFCSYCVVPFSRGRAKFRSLRSILEETERLVSAGYKEIQFLGQNVNIYRDPETRTTFGGLLSRADKIPGVGWIRFVTSHPRDLVPETAAAIAASRHVCRQIHLPLQAGSSAILARMNRGYTREDFEDRIALLRRLTPGIAISTDIIVGFPGETEGDFAETLGALEEIRFASIFSFKYSPRPWTAAARLPDDVPTEVKRRRLLEVQALQKRIQTELHGRLVGRTLEVLCLGRSRKDPRVYSGRSEGNHVVNFTSPADPVGTVVRVEITGFGPYSLRGSRLA
jgi:tRNA-2-methylthio-N6-dimethylallyladenosine synthase